MPLTYMQIPKGTREYNFKSLIFLGHWYSNDFIFAANLVAENSDNASLEEEILSVLDVPPGKMGCVIGRRGASILSIKESCKYFSFQIY